jgi:hypothetical protein
MVGHQHVGMDGTVTGIRNAFQDLQVLEIILHLEKHRFPVMASLHEVGGNVRKVESCFSWHRLTGFCGVDGGRAIR